MEHNRMGQDWHRWDVTGWNRTGPDGIVRGDGMRRDVTGREEAGRDGSGGNAMRQTGTFGTGWVGRDRMGQILSFVENTARQVVALLVASGTCVVPRSTEKR